MCATKTVIVSGASGFVGRATVAALRDAGWRTIQGSRTAGTLLAQGIVCLDLEDPATILALAKGPRSDAIVHLGARISWSGISEADMFTPNVLATGCLAYLASVWDARLIFASTAIVHGAKTEAINSESPVCPDTAYARSKWLAEQLLDASNARRCILRIAGVFGCNGPGHLGLNRAIESAIKGEPPLQVGSGAALRNYVYVKDVAQAVVHALEQHLVGTHLLAGHEVISIGAMLYQICDILAPDLHPVIKEGPRVRDQVIVPSASLPRTRSFCDALRDIREGCGA